MRQECLGPEQQFPQAFAGRKDSPFLGSDSLVEEEQQSKLEMLLHRVQAPESRLSTFAKNPRSAAKTGGAGPEDLSFPPITAAQRDRVTGHFHAWKCSSFRHLKQEGIV